MKTLAIIQARTSSTRLPGKVLEVIGGLPMIIYQLQRVSRSSEVDKVVVATSDHTSDDELASLVEKAGYPVFRGDLDDVLSRFHACCQVENPSAVVRLTGDCPLTDPSLVDELVKEFFAGSWDYLANCADESNLSVPDGFDVEIFRADLLRRAILEAKLPSEREHVTPWFRRSDSSLNWGHYKHSPVRSYYRVTVDDPIDLEVVRRIVDSLGPKDLHFDVDDVVQYLDANPDVAALNIRTVRNEGYLKSLASDGVVLEKSLSPNGQSLWARAKIIPGGNMLLSKRAEMFLPEQWPAYFSRAKGCLVWDIDGRELIDMSIMGMNKSAWLWTSRGRCSSGQYCCCREYEHSQLSRGGFAC